MANNQTQQVLLIDNVVYFKYKLLLHVKCFYTRLILCKSWIHC